MRVSEGSKGMKSFQLPSLTGWGAFSFCILLLVILPSCAKNPRHQTPETSGRDTLARTQELRDSSSGSSRRMDGATLQAEAPGDRGALGNGSGLVDTLVGSVHVVGNEPFTRLALALEQGRRSIFIQADTTRSRQLRTLQGRVVRIFGTIVRNETGDYVRLHEFMIVQ